MKALAGTTWGQDNETLIITYKSIGRSVLSYGSPIWSPLISETNWSKLQRVQNSALKISTGTYHNASWQHVHRETKVLPLREHEKMVAEQYLAACYLPDHPGGKHLDRPPPPPRRNLKKTLLEYKKDVEPLYANLYTEENYKFIKKEIHTDTVESTISAYPDNKVLGRTPPPLSKEETKLPRKARATLSQLRSGYSKMLNSYNNTLDETIPDECPLCSQSPHNTAHLFTCPANPTNLNIESLWTQPLAAATFLNLDMEHEPG